MDNSEISFAYNIKIIILGIGLLFFIASVYFYHRSIFKTQSDIDASFGSWRILVKRATPGTLFLLAATIIISIAIAKKMGATSASKSIADRNELRKSIEPLKIESTSETNTKAYLNIDSMCKSASNLAAKEDTLML